VRWRFTLLEKCQQVWERLLSRSTEENRFLVLAPVVGVVTGLAVVAVAHLTAFLQRVFWGSDQHLLDAARSSPWYWRILAPTVGGLIVGGIGYLFKVETRGGGTTALIQGLMLKGGVVRLRQMVPRAMAALITIASGGSLGREGPMMSLGGAIGSSLGRRFSLTTPQLRILLCAASASAIAAVYNAPIGGSLFALEILMGNFALEVFGPVVVASVISTFVFRASMGDLPRFVAPQYQLVSGWELIAYLALGMLGGGVSVVFTRSLFFAQNAVEKLRIPKWISPALGLAVVGGIGVFYPQVFGNGFEIANEALHENLPLRLLVILPFVKLAATAISFGARGAGGLFTPSLVVGGLMGGAFGYLVHDLFPNHTAGYGAYALVGMGAIVAGTTYAPLTAIMLIYEQTNSYLIVLPLMFTCIISTATVRAFHTNPIHVELLRRRGIKLPRGPEESVMQTLTVRDVMHEEIVSVRHDAPFHEIVERFLKEPCNNLYVVNEEGAFLGAIRLHGMKAMLHQTEALRSVIARDLVDDSCPCFTPDQRLADTMEIFWREHSERLPVIESTQSRRLIGWLAKRDLFGVYSQEILRKRQLLGRFSIKHEDGARDVFVELPEGFQITTLLIPPTIAGRTIGELALRSRYNLHALQLKRLDPTTGRPHIDIPSPDSHLNTDDRLTVIGPAEGLARFQLAMYSTAENHDDDD
jgi:CIC family chloride channel protein